MAKRKSVSLLSDAETAAASYNRRKLGWWQDIQDQQPEFAEEILALVQEFEAGGTPFTSKMALCRFLHSRPEIDVSVSSIKEAPFWANSRESGDR